MKMTQLWTRRAWAASLLTALATTPAFAQNTDENADAGAVKVGKMIERIRPRDAHDSVGIPGGGGKLWYDVNKWAAAEPQNGTIILTYHPGLGQMRLIRRPEAATIDEQIERLLDGVRQITSDVEVNRRERQLVNGVECTLIEIVAKPADDPPVLYYGLLYADGAKAIQLMGLTGQSLIPDYRADFDFLLDGLEIEQ